eukprot:scaffold5657_cov54-Phaeocystis_antarctica.AAC.2
MHIYNVTPRPTQNPPLVVLTAAAHTLPTRSFASAASNHNQSHTPNPPTAGAFSRRVRGSKVQARCCISRCRAASAAPAAPAAPTAPAAWRLRCHRRQRLGEAADDTAKAVVRDECLALQLGARLRRGILGAQPLRDGLALVGEPVQRADGVDHDLGGDRAHVVVGHLRCLTHLRSAGRHAAAALAGVSRRTLQHFGLRCHCCHRRDCRRLLGCLAYLERCCRPHRLSRR